MVPPNLTDMIKSNKDFYDLLSAAVDFDASFADEDLLMFHLEEGRIYDKGSSNSSGNNNKKKDQQRHQPQTTATTITEFEKSILILQKRRRSRSTDVEFGSILQMVLAWLSTLAKKELPARAITPSVLSGLCSFARTVATTSDDDDNKSSNNNNNSITVSSSDLVLFCQGLQHQALGQLRRKRRRKQFFYVCFLSVSLATSVTRLSKKLDAIDHRMKKLQYNRTNDACHERARPTTPIQQVCRIMDGAVFRVLSGIDEEQQQQQGKSIYAAATASAAKYAMHMSLANDTIAWHEVAAATANENSKDRAISGGAGHYNNNNNNNNKNNNAAASSVYVSNNDGLPSAVAAQETVVNRMVRQIVLESYPTDDPLSVLDVGSGLGATLHSLIPILLRKNGNHDATQLQNRRPSRRHAEKLMLSYTGFSLSAGEAQRAQTLAERLLTDLGQEKVVNVSFKSHNFVPKESSSSKILLLLPAELQKSATYNLVVCIESLSYVDQSQLQHLIQAMYKSLKVGGLLIFVDDVVLQKDPQDMDLHTRQRIDYYRASWMRPSLIRHIDWVSLFKAAGFTLIEDRDLTLEFDLFPDNEEDQLAYSLFGRFFKEGWDIVVTSLTLHLLKILESDYFTRAHTRLQLWLQMLLLKKGSFSAQQSYAQRKSAFRAAELGYNLYILKK